MTIKQQGGVFGRNPTFNNIEVDGKLSGGDLRGDSLGVGVDSLSYQAEFAKAGSPSYIMVNTTGASASGLLIGAEGTLNAIYSGTGPGNLAGKPLFLYQGFTHVCNTTAAGNLAFPSGQGIDFSATAGTGTSELFDDYEEGTWTPALSYDTAGTSSFTYAIQQGYYTKVGRSVTAQFKVQLTNFSKGTASGSLNITGLPYTPVGSEALPVGSIVLYDAPFSNTPVIVAIHGFPILRLLQISNNAAWANIDDPDTNSQYLGSVTYFV